MPSLISYNSTIKLGPLALGVYTSPSVALGEVTSISFDGVAQSTIEVTQLTDAVKKYAAGLLDPGSISMEVNLDQDDATQTLLFTAATDRVLRSYLISFGTAGGGMTVHGVGIVTGFSVKAGLDAVLSASFTIKCSAAYTITALT
jgi:hypothetical protein